VLPLFGEQADDQARIQTARQQHADRHIRDQTALDRST
jgi:hypothetical protein